MRPTLIDEQEQMLVDFGNYLLSDYRKSMVHELVQNTVHHADIQNFLDLGSEIPSPVSPSATETLTHIDAN